MTASDGDDQHRRSAAPNGAAERWPSLTTPAMAPVWTVVKERLERRGTESRGRVALPALDAPARLTLTGLLGRPPSSRLDLASVETGLRRVGVGDDLRSALAELGFPVSPEPARRRAAAVAGRDARAAARAEATTWVEPWAEEWIDGVVRAGVLRGMGRDEAVAFVGAVRRVLDAIDEHAGTLFVSPLSRVDLAARVLGDAHALDSGSRLEAAVSRALVRRVGPTDARDAWEGAGIHLDLTSGPALTWNLPLRPGSELAPLVRAATDLGAPLHLSRFMLETAPVAVVAEAHVLVVENPRVVEAAAQARSAHGLVSAGGAPSGAVQLLVRQLIGAGATVRYHGDFDAAGLTLCARMAAAGVEPWQMTAAAYRDALAEADADGVELPRDEASPPDTPWDPTLATAFAAERRVVHEERLLRQILGV